MPMALMRRYVTAASRMSPSPPRATAMGRARAATAAATGTPSTAHSHSPWAATADAPLPSPRPVSSATRVVVPNDSTLLIHASVLSTIDAMATAASGVVPRRPTMAVSART